MQVSAKLRRAQSGYAHWCPACEEMHALPDGWTFDGNLELPTFSPSFKHTGKQTIKKDGRWTGEWARDANGNAVDWCCHYVLNQGVLHFCTDCSHALKGRSVPLPDLPAEFRDHEHT